MTEEIRKLLLELDSKLMKGLLMCVNENGFVDVREHALFLTKVHALATRLRAETEK